MKKPSIILRVLLISLVCLTACNRAGQYPNGVVFVAPLGKPPVNYIIWSPVSNSEILVNANHLQPGASRIYVLDISTGKEHTLLETKQGHLWSQNWLPGGSEVIVGVSPGTVEFEDGGLWKINTRDNSMEPIDDSFASQWSPDGSRRAYESKGQNENALQSGVDIHVITNPSNEDEIVYSEPGAERTFGISWSPTGDEIAFSVGDYRSRDLKVLNLKTRKARKLSDTGNYMTPVWSPSSDIIAFNASHDGIKYTIHFIRPDGSCDFEFQGIDDARSLTWSPDGRKLAFVGSDGMYYLDIDKIFKDGLATEICP